MFKVLHFIKRKPHMTHEQFKEHFERSGDPGKPFNTLVLRGSATADYRKIHLYDSFGYRESDRLTGGASHGAKFELEVVSTGVSFETTIHLRNFEIWQLGLLFIVLQDLRDELIHIGSGRSRGLGKVTATVNDQPSSGRPGGFVTSTLRASQEPEDQRACMRLTWSSRPPCSVATSESGRSVASAAGRLAV